MTGEAVLACVFVDLGYKRVDSRILFLLITNRDLEGYGLLSPESSLMVLAKFAL